MTDFENFNNFTLINKLKYLQLKNYYSNFSIQEQALLHSLEISAINQWLFKDRLSAYENFVSFYSVLKERNDLIEAIFLTHKIKNLMENKKINDINEIIINYSNKFDGLIQNAILESDTVLIKYILRFYLLCINYYKITKSYQKAVETCEKSISLALKINNSFFILITVDEILNYVCNTESIEKLQLYEKKYNFYFEKDKNPQNLFYKLKYIYLLIEIYYWDYGKSRVALEYINKGFQLLPKLEITSEGNITLLSAYYTLKGIIYSNNGNNKEAIQIFKEGEKFDTLIFNNFNNPIPLGNCYGNIGEIYYDFGNYRKALEYQNESVLLRERMGDSQYVAESYFHLVLVNLKLGDKEESGKYLDKLHALLVRWNNTTIPLTNDIQARYDIALAYSMKESNTFKDNLQADELLQKWTNINLRPDLKTRAILLLLELVLQEFKFDKNIVTFGKIQELINNLEKMVKDSGSVPLKIRALLLKAKLNLLVENNISFEQYLVVARNLAQEFDLNQAEKLITEELSGVQNEISVWEEILMKNATLKERLEAIDIEKYIQDLQQIVDEKMNNNNN